MDKRIQRRAICGLFFFLAAFCLTSLAQSIPSEPTDVLVAAVSANQINLSWTDQSNNEDGFKIERSTDGTNFTQIAQVLPNTTNYRNAGLWPGSLYFFRVRAYNSTGNSDFSNTGSAATPSLCPLSIVSWGWNFSNQVTVPPGLTGVIVIAVGYHHNLVLKDDGNIVGWGSASGGATMPPPGLTGVTALSAGLSFSLALKSDGTVVGWGTNSAGQATPPAGLSNALAISAGQYHGLALKSDGTVVGWGSNSEGQGAPVPGVAGVVAIAAGPYHNLALKSDGTVVGWGYNYAGQASPPAGLTNAVAIGAGGNYGLALKGDGTVISWGLNDDMIPPSGLSNVVAIVAGYWHALALKSDGTVVAWGANYSDASTPPTGLKNVIAIGAGTYDSLVLTSPCVLGAPTPLVATAVSSNQIDLSWADNAKNEDRFGIERAMSSDGPWAEIASISSNVTVYLDSEVSCGQTSFYRVRCYNAASESPYSNIASATISPNDADCDGIPNSWVQQFFGHPTGEASDKSRATDDADGDGQNNLAEFQAGTDPTNSASAFRILEIWPDDDDMFITWTAVGGRRYILQTTTNLGGSLSNNFLDLNPAIVAWGTAETDVTVLHMGAATNSGVRIYRVRLVP